MPNVLTVVTNQPSGVVEKLILSIALSGAYVQANAAGTPPTGEIVTPLSGVVENIEFEGATARIEAPYIGFLLSGVLPGGYFGVLVPVPVTTGNPTQYVLQIFTAEGTELAAGAYPAALLAASATSQILAEFDFETLA